MMSATNGKQSCSKSDKSQCDYNDFRRPRYFHGKLLDDKDFRLEQSYHAGKRRLLNRTLHGSGVVCGLDLTWKKDGVWLDVSPGIALDNQGNEIWVETTEHVDISKLLPPADAAAKQPCPPPETAGNKSYYVAICYHEAATDPVPVYLPGSSCDNRTCDYSADKEGYCVKLLSECPQADPKSGLLKDLCDAIDCSPEQKPPSDCHDCGKLEGSALCRCYVLETFCEKSVTCPPCDHSCCVVLGRIELDKKGTIQNVCINECREYVLSGRFMKYLIAFTLTGANKIFQVREKPDIKVIDGSDIARNPIQALCWLVRYFVIEKNHLDLATCRDLLGGAAAAGKVSVADFEKIKSRMDVVDAAVQKGVSDANQRIEALSADFQKKQDTFAKKLKEIETRLPSTKS